MPSDNPDGPILYSLEAEEALVAALLLHDDIAALAHFDDDDLWYDHLRPITRAVRSLHAVGKPFGLVFVCWWLDQAGELDALSWRGDRAEVLVCEVLNRHLEDVQTFYGVSLAKLVHDYAEKRKAARQAQGAATRAYRAVLNQAGRRFAGGTQIP